jgi:C4-dicarboxylate-specific signal transduction histidine kinase
MAIPNCHGELATRSAQDGQTLLAEVRDSRHGIHAEGAGEHFEAFYTTKVEGIGSRLSISRSIIEAHGGRLWFSANTPQGAVFQFSLPVET